MGMGARIPVLTNILRDHEPRESLTGYRFPDDAENRSRWRRWWLHAVREQVLFFWLLNSFIILLFIVASLAVWSTIDTIGRHPVGRLRAFYEGKEISFLALEAVALGNVFAPLTTLFLLVAVATLLSTQLTLVDGSRAACRHRPHEFRRGSKATPRFLVCGGGRCLDSPRLFSHLRIESSTRAQSFLFLTGFSGGIAMAIYCPLTLVMNRRFLPAAATPGRLMTTLMP